LSYQVQLLSPEPCISDESLDLGGLEDGLFTLALGDGSPHDKLPDIDVSAGAVEFSNLGGSLGTESPGDLNIGEAWDVLLALLHDDEVNDDDVGSDDATADSLSFKLASLAGPEAGVDLAQQEAGPALNDHTLHHSESLLIVAARNFKDVALELVTEDASIHLSSHPLVKEGCAL